MGLAAEQTIYPSNPLPGLILKPGDTFEIATGNLSVGPIPIPSTFDLCFPDLIRTITAGAINGHRQPPRQAVWGIPESALPLEPGATLVLTLEDQYFARSLSRWRDALVSGTVIYVQVDSAAANSSHGAVREEHEYEGRPTNNISGPVLIP